MSTVKLTNGKILQEQREMQNTQTDAQLENSYQSTRLGYLWSLILRKVEMEPQIRMKTG